MDPNELGWIYRGKKISVWGHFLVYIHEHRKRLKIRYVWYNAAELLIAHGAAEQVNYDIGMNGQAAGIKCLTLSMEILEEFFSRPEARKLGELFRNRNRGRNQGRSRSGRMLRALSQTLSKFG